MYSDPPLMRPPLGNEKCGHIRGVAIDEGGHIWGDNCIYLYTSKETLNFYIN